jgi:MarR family transcriptional regulator for hemolysin
MQQHAAELARAFLEVVPRTMWLVRAEVRKAAKAKSGGSLSVPQIRVLAQLKSAGRTNGELAEILGMSVPAMSRLVDGLVRRGFVARAAHRKDRRIVTLALTTAGKQYFLSIMKTVENCFSRQFAELAPDRAQMLARGLGILEETLR